MPRKDEVVAKEAKPKSPRLKTETILRLDGVMERELDSPGNDNISFSRSFVRQLRRVFKKHLRVCISRKVWTDKRRAAKRLVVHEES